MMLSLRRLAFLFLISMTLTFAGSVVLPSVTANDSAISGFFPGGEGSAFLTVNWGGGQQNVGLLQFDLSAYAGDSISSATLDLYHLWNGVAGAQFGILENTSAWVGVTTDWASRPSTSTGPTLVIGDDESGVWRSVDITAIVQGWLSGASPNYGLTLERLDQENPTAFFTSATGTYAGEAIYAPKLDLSTGIPEPATAGMVALALALAALARRKRTRT